MLEVRVLGALEVARDGVRVELGSPSERRVVAALVAGGGIAGRDRLVDAVWGDESPPSAVRSLQTYVSRLRRALGAGRIQTRPPGWVLHADVVDAREFERLVAEARATSGREAVAAFDAALAWWRGQAFAEFAAEPFALAEARRLEELRLGARVDRARVLLDVGALADSIGALRSLVAEEPHHERAWELLVRALAADGRSAEALRAAQRCRQELAAVGLEPCASIARAERAALSGDARSLPREAERPRQDLPGGVGELVGRGTELARLEELVKPGCCLTLVGPGGVGKSRLAIEVAAALADRFPAGAFFCDLMRVEQAESVVPELGVVLGAPLTAPLEERLISFCRQRSLLVVLDNCEHLVDEVARVTGLLLEAAPGMAMVATSREPLRIRREHVVRIEPLAPVDAVRLYQLRSAAAGALPDNPQAIEELCGRLDNLPLGIEMAAGWSRSLTARELAALVASDRSPLAHPARDVVARHRTLDAAVGWSYDLLPDDERRLLERFSVFAGAVDLDSALTVAAPDKAPEESARWFMDLVDRSLVLTEHAGGETRFRMLETTRAFAADALRRRGEQPAALADHAEWAARLAEKVAAGYRTAQAARWAERAERMLAELRAAVYRCLDIRRVDLALRIVAALGLPAYDWLRADISSWACTSVEEAVGTGVEVPPHARVCAALGTLHGGQFEAAWTMVESVRGAFAAVVRADTGLYTGDYDRCAREALIAIEAAEAEGDGVLLTLALLDLALAQGYGGDTEGALATAARVRAAAEASGAPSALAWAHFLEGELLLDTAPERARPLLERALRDGRAIRSALTEGIALVSLTTLEARHGDSGQAVAAFEEAIRHWHRRDDWTHQHVTLRNLVTLLERLGADEDAAVLLGALDRDTPRSLAATDQLPSTHRRLLERLGPQFAALTARGQTLDRHEVVALAQNALAAQHAESSRRTPA